MIRAVRDSKLRDGYARALCVPIKVGIISMRAPRETETYDLVLTNPELPRQDTRLFRIFLRLVHMIINLRLNSLMIFHGIPDHMGPFRPTTDISRI